jgi:uncharacterized protein (DUF2141 family)
LNTLKNIVTGFVFVTLFLSCARIGTPPGGPKDEDPPVVVKAKPGNYATQYNKNKVVIEFDEFITLKDVFNEFTISPPLEEAPMPHTNGKKVVIDLPHTELDSLTYTMDFGLAIADNNEGNLLPNFQFVVSKQAHIDSFSVSGIVLDAFTHQPGEKSAFVYLHNNLEDSAFKTTIPTYLGRTSPEGKFTINHIAPGTYRIFALEDANSNMKFDLETEIVAFANEPVYLYPDSFPAVPDSVITPLQPLSDSIDDPRVDVSPESGITFSTSEGNIEIDIPDSLLPDTSGTEIMVYGYSINLYTFTQQQDVKQYLTEYDRKAPEKFDLLFNAPQTEAPGIELLNIGTNEDWYLLESSEHFDTLVYWLTDSTILMTDSLLVGLTYPETDTTGEAVMVTDTLIFFTEIETPEEKDEEASGKKKRGINLGLINKEEEIDTLPPAPPRVKYKTNLKTAGHHLYQPVVITPEAPVFDYDAEKVKLFRMEDTLEFPAKFTLETFVDDFRKAVLEIDYEPNTQYVLHLYEGAFTDIYGRTIDSTKIRFKTQRDDYYGSVEMQMIHIQSPMILQLLDSKEKIVKQAFFAEDKNVVFDFLNPGNYKLKLIFDDNENGIWDTGNYETFLQPEKVIYFPTEPEVKENWSVEYEWELK